MKRVLQGRYILKRISLILVMLWTVTAMQGQIDFKLYMANNIGELESVAKLKGSNSGLKWKEVTDGITVGNRAAMVEVRDMFKSSRQKTRQDQETFWKMRDNNMLCFRINEGKNNSQYEVRVKSTFDGEGCLKRNVSNYFFINTDNHDDSLFINVVRVGTKDTLHLRYDIFDWGNDRTLVFKLDSRRQKTGLTYQLEYVLKSLDGQKKRTHTRSLQGNTFQSIYIPEDSTLGPVYFVSNDKKIELKERSTLHGVNLSSKLNTLYLSPNFRLDKHKNRELTIFNMLGSGLFEQFDTLYVEVLGDDGQPIECTIDETTGLAKGFAFNIAEVDQNGKYVANGPEMKYVGYNKTMKKHKLLTYGSPCYIEVIAPGYYPLLYKCPGAFNRETKVLAKKYTEASVKPIKGTTTADKPAISNFQLYVLEKVSDDIITRDGIDYREFKIDKKDMKAKPASGFYMFAEDGCYQVNEKLVNNQPLVGGKYADIAISYSIAKEKTGTDTQATLKMEEGGSAVTLATKATDIIDGRDYKPLTRSWYEIRWELLGKLAKKDVNYKPRLRIGNEDYNQLPFLKRIEVDERKKKEDAKKEAEDYIFNNNHAVDGESNILTKQSGNVIKDGWISVLGQIAKLDIRADKFPGINFSVTPNFDPFREVFDLDILISWAKRNNKEVIGEDENGDPIMGDTQGKKMRDNLKNQGREQRFRVWDIGEKENRGGQGWNMGLNTLNNTKSSMLDKEHWIQSQMDDIFKVDGHRLGWGFGFEAHVNFGWKWGDSNKSGQTFALNAAEGRATFGYYIQHADTIKFSKWLPTNLKVGWHVNLTLEASLALGVKTYNFMNNGAITRRQMGFFVDITAVGKGGGGAALKTFFGNSDGTDAAANDDNMTTESNKWGTRFFYWSLGARVGAKGQFQFSLAKFWGDTSKGERNRWDYGCSVLLFAGAEFYFDMRLGPFIRINPRFSGKLSGFWAWPDNDTNPSIPLYPNYHGGKSAPSLTSMHRDMKWLNAIRRAASARPEFPLSHCVMEGLNDLATPYFLSDNSFVTVNNGTGVDPDENTLTEYTLPTITSEIEKSSGKVAAACDYVQQHHFLDRAGENEVLVYEEMTRKTNTDLANFDEEIDQGRHIQIVSLMRGSNDNAWLKYVVANDENVHDSKPVVAINVFSDDKDDRSSIGVSGDAACVWKRGQYVLPPYEDKNATAEKNEKSRQAFVNSYMRAFEGDLVLSTFNGEQWSAPESILKLNKKDHLTDYKVLMRNDSVLAAVLLLPEGRDSLELRYYCKPSGEGIRYVGTDVLDPLAFSMDIIGGQPTIAILNRVDSANNDIYVKHIDLMGRFTGYGTDLSIARFNPNSVRILVDRDNARPDDFAVLWECEDRAIYRDGKTTATDSTQTMLNCSRIFMRDNMAVTPYITLGCTADSTRLVGYDAYLDGTMVKVLYALNDLRNGKTYLMKDGISFYDDFKYTVSYSRDAMINSDILPINVHIYNTGSTPITAVEGYVNDQWFSFDEHDDIFIDPYSELTLTVDYLVEDGFDGLLKAHDVAATFEDYYQVQKVSRRGAPVRRSMKSEDELVQYATGVSDIEVKLLSQSIKGTKNTVYLELTDHDGLNDNETVHVGLYPSAIDDVPITSSAEVLLKASDFSLIGEDRKAHVELTVDGLEEEQQVEVRARVYNDRILESLKDDEDASEAIVNNLSWYDNRQVVTLLPTELDNVTLLPVVKKDATQRKVRIEQVEQGVWISGLEEGDFVRIFDAAGLALYQQSRPTSRLFVPIDQHGVYLLSTGQEIVKFSF